ncbi:hypothetical protein H0H93_000570 [Arthromyces matolae]|nr:hypothetical protein H0H93_000570 [Arthromyces matolae]
MEPHSSKATKALQHAEKVYTQYLTAEERSRINTPITLDTLVTVTRKWGDDLQSRGDSDHKFSTALRVLGEKATLLESFERLVEGAAKMSPSAGSMIWGSILFTLEMVKNNANNFDEVLKFFQRFADEVGYINLQKQTFTASELVQSVAEDLYAAILNFWVAAVKYYRAQCGGLRARIKKFVMASSIDKRFEMLKGEIAQQKMRLDSAASAQHSADSSYFYKDIKSFQHTARHKEVKEWLNAADYKHDYRTAKGLRYQGTCEWILKKPVYTTWESLTSSSFLYIHGIPGAGKTVLSSWIINHLQTTRDGDILLYHYFKDSEANKRDPLSALRSFIDQLLNHLRLTTNPLLKQLESDLHKACLDCGAHAGYADLWDLFLSSVVAVMTQPQTSHAVTFVMDAMDECQSPLSLISDVLSLSQAHQGGIRILVTGRKSVWDMITRSGLSSLDELEITTEDVHDDIQAFVRYTISNVSRLSSHDTLRDELTYEIGKASNHQGMFIWAYFMCEEVQRQGDPRALQSLLEHLPRGLDAMYGRICEAIIKSDDGLGFTCSVLQWLVNSPRPMRFSELQAALKLVRSSPTNATVTKDVWFDQTDDLLWSRQDIVDACGNIVVYTGLDDGDSFRLVHLSATQFFRSDLDQAKVAIFSEAQRIFVGEIQNAGFKLATFCLQYLNVDKLLFHEYVTSSLKYDYYCKPVVNEIDFLKQFPFFQFGVAYWPDFVLTGLSANSKRRSAFAPSFLTHAFASFISSSAMFIWFVHATILLNIEIVTDTLDQLAKIDGETVGLVSISSWALKFIRILTLYRLQFSHCPELIRKCWPMEPMPGITVPLVRTWQIGYGVDKKATPGTNYLPLSDVCHWIHYDSQKDLLFSIEDLRMRLRIHSMKTSVSMRPGIVFPHFDAHFFLRAAAVSSSSQYVAAIFDTGVHDVDVASHSRFLICWRLPWHGFGATLQPGLVLCETFHAAYHAIRTSLPYSPVNIIPSNIKNYLAFIGDDVLVTPRGLWNLKRAEWLPETASLYQPITKIGIQCLSGNGRRVAQICGGGNEIGFIETQTGKLISQLSFPDADYLYLLALSNSGSKLVFHYRQSLLPAKMVRGCDNVYARWCTGFGNRLSCLIVNDEQHLINLDTPYHIHIDGDMQPEFSKDEETIVACIIQCPDGCPFPRSSGIGLWKLAKDTQGRHLHASFTHHYKSESISSFCVAPALHDGPDNVVVVTSHGVVKRPLSMPWSKDEEEAFLHQQPRVKHKFIALDDDPKEMIITVKTIFQARTSNDKASVSFMKWSFRSQSPQMVANSTCTLDVPIRIIPSWVSNATYIVADDALLRVFDNSAALEGNKQARISLATHLEGVVKAVAFSARNDRVVLLYRNGHESNATVIMNDIRDGSLFTVAASTVKIDIEAAPDRKLVYRLNFNPVNSSQLLFTVFTLGFNDAINLDLELMELVDDYTAVRHPELRAVFCLQLLAEKLVSTKIDFPDDTIAFSPSLADRRIRYPYDVDVEFSQCGVYLVWRVSPHWQPDDRNRIYSLMHWQSLKTSDADTHPVVTKNAQPFIYDQHVFVFQDGGSSIYLRRQPLGNLQCLTERLLCIVPSYSKYTYRGHRNIFLIWPEDSNDEVKVVVVVDGDPVVIETGILSRDLMKEDAWYTRNLNATEEP